MNNYLDHLDDSIDVKELLFALWAHKITVLIITLSTICFGTFYAINADKVFTAKAIVKLEKNNQQSSNVPTDIFALAGLDTGGGDRLGGIVERITARIFVEEIDRLVDLKSDVFFNSYKPQGVEAEWKTFIKDLIGYTSAERNENEVIWTSILGVFRENVLVSVSEANSLVIEVTHNVPERSAEIANIIMMTIIEDERRQSESGKEFHLNYLSNALAGSLFELEKAQNDLQNFTLNKSSLPKESFAVATIKLESEKIKLEQTSKLYFAVKEMADIYENHDKNILNYKKLRMMHPIVDEVVFRRIFGQNEIVTAWTWPDQLTVENVLDTLADRKNRLKVIVSKAQDDAEILAASVERYSNYMRNVKEAEAVYTVMLEQVKQNSIISGYNPETSTIYEYASPPINPSAPNRKIMIMISFLLGLFFSFGIVFILSFIRGVYYSNTSMQLVQKVNYNSKTKLIRRLARKSMEKMNLIAESNTKANLRDLKLEINNSNKKFILISGLGSKLKAVELSRVLGVSMQADGKKISHINFSNIKEPKKKESKNESGDLFSVFDKFKDFDMLTPIKIDNKLNFLTKHDAKTILSDLSNKYDFVILSAEGNDALSLARFQDTSDTYHIILTRKNRTKRKKFEEICYTLPLGALLHD
jgi:uncharacterized protein involved in exopolysaccharide biosynthesis